MLNKFTKRDLYFCLLTGFITGFAVWKIFDYLHIVQLFPYIFLLGIVPGLWILGISLGYFLGQWLPFFSQFGKFAAIGFTNAAVDFGILNLLIASTGIASGIWYSGFKAISFLAAVIPSYFWNKHWAFDASRTSVGGFEFAKFFGVAVVSTFINTGVASFVVNYLQPVLGLTSQVWANIGAVAGSAGALIFSFAGFKFAVFKK